MSVEYTNNPQKRIISGFFPTERMHSVPFSKAKKIDIEGQKKAGEEILLQGEEFIILFLKEWPALTEVLRKAVSSPQMGLLVERSNALINTGYRVDELPLNGKAYQAASQLCPYVTPLDRVLATFVELQR